MCIVSEENSSIQCKVDVISCKNGSTLESIVADKVAFSTDGKLKMLKQ